MLLVLVLFARCFLIILIIRVNNEGLLCVDNNNNNNNENEEQLGLCLAVPAAWCVSLGFGCWIQAGDNSARFVRQLGGFQKLKAVHQPSELRH